jgi:maltooligosyltrehalose trehalohydrolase
MTSSRLGATPRSGGCRFEVWAPYAKKVEVELEGTGKRIPMQPTERGYHVVEAPGVGAGSRYRYRLDGTKTRNDPAARFLPEGITGPTEVVDPGRFRWTDRGWKGQPLQDLVVYELHVGTYTAEGTFEALIPHLKELRELGITAIELMPVAQFPGKRNWGYDGVQLFAPQNSYGGPLGLQRLVDAAHKEGLSVLLDVVYNHLGPEGNFLPDFGPYFNDKRPTPWGSSVNVDGRDSDEVRRFFIENALQWLRDFHLDGLRLDAVHAIVDMSARTFMEDLSERIDAAATKRGVPFHLIAESSANDPRLVRRRADHGWGLHGMWNDDFSHALYAFTTHDPTKYGGDYAGSSSLAKAYRNAFVLDGGYSTYRRRRHGRPALGIPSRRFVVCADNHDQVGNRARGERLSQLVSPNMLKVSAAAVTLSPFVPMFFMGEEYAERAPFLYFTDHASAELRAAVTRGRKKEFEQHGWNVEPMDHADAKTFETSRLDHRLKLQPGHAEIRAFYKRLLELRRTHPVLRLLDHAGVESAAQESDRIVTVLRRARNRQAFLILHNGPKRATVKLSWPKGDWELLLDSSAKKWAGPGNGHPPTVQSNGRHALEVEGETALLYEARERP